MISRRDFLKGLGAAVVAVPLAKVAIENIPVLYGDGKTNDTDALQALINGDPVMLKSDGSIWRQIIKDGKKTVRIPSGTFKICETLFLPPNISIIEGSGKDKTLLYFDLNAALPNPTP